MGRPVVSAHVHVLEREELALARTDVPGVDHKDVASPLVGFAHRPRLPDIGLLDLFGRGAGTYSPVPYLITLEKYFWAWERAWKTERVPTCAAIFFQSRW